jgi:hypothetical protein
MISQSEYLAMHARCEAARSKASDVVFDSPRHERDLHESILAACRLRNWIVFHGSMAHRTFRTPGEPDFVVLADGGRTWLIEAKTRHGKLTTDQLGLQLWAKKLGHTVAVIRSMKEFYALIA